MLGCRYSQNKTQETVKEKTIARVCVKPNLVMFTLPILLDY